MRTFVLKEVRKTFPEFLIPENVEDLVDGLYSVDNRKVGRNARKEQDNENSGFSYGLIEQVKKAIQLYNRINQGPGKSYKEARDDRILYITTSSGRTPRKWCR